MDGEILLREIEIKRLVDKGNLILVQRKVSSLIIMFSFAMSAVTVKAETKQECRVSTDSHSFRIRAYHKISTYAGWGK